MTRKHREKNARSNCPQAWQQDCVDRGADRAPDYRSGEARQSQFPRLCDLQVGNDDRRDQRIKGMLQVQKLSSSDSQ